MALSSDRSSIQSAMSETAEPGSPKNIRVNESVTVLRQPEFNDQIYPPPQATKKWLTTRAAVSYDKVALVAAGIGIFTGLSLCTLIVNKSLGLYMLSIATFHFLEFWVTARYNPKTLGMYSFLLLNGPEYCFAHMFAVFEYLVSWYVKGSAPQLHGIPLVLVFAAVMLGQFLRTGAMICAAQSFNHYVQYDRRADHKLVKSGVYAYMRHPSYSGYFLWSVALEVLIRNWIAAAASCICLYIYFCARLRSEEAALIRFFGDDYEQYMKTVWSGIPFRK